MILSISRNGIYCCTYIINYNNAGDGIYTYPYIRNQFLKHTGPCKYVIYSCYKSYRKYLVELESKKSQITTP